MIFSPIKGYEGLYEVSTQGEVRSIDRQVEGKDGVIRAIKGRTLRTAPNKDVEYLQVSLWKENKGSSHYVHRLVAITHIPNPFNLPEVNHKNGIRYINTVENLEWVTQRENIQHAISTGLKIYTNRLTKEEFIECLYCIIEGESYKSLCERVPYKVPFLSTKVRAIAKELNLENELNEAIYIQQVNRARINGAKNY